MKIHWVIFLLTCWLELLVGICIGAKHHNLFTPETAPPTVIIQGCYLEDNSWPDGLNRDLSNLKEIYAGLKDRRLKLDSAIHAEQVKNGSQEHY